MRHLVLGTAGHIDHGKSSLVKALTGIDPDRLKEEKLRGITIDLGFADLEVGPDRTLSFVDVPGHERFVRHMVAGAGGIDAVLLVVAADEGVKPQTREHLGICSLLGIDHGIVVITKSDLVDKEVLEVVALEVREFLEKTFLESAPIRPVSSRTGAGLAPLRESLLELFDVVPERPSTGVPRLPIDRSFVLRGFGTVVTGTLAAGLLREGQEVTVLPGGAVGRVRGLQVHHRKVLEARAGQRTAVNLQGLSCAVAARGRTLSTPGGLPTTRRVRARLRLLPSSPKRFRRSGKVRFHQGTWEGSASVRVLQETTGGLLEADVALAAEAVLLPGDRFVVRLPSPVGTIGGGTVVDIRPRKGRSSAPLPVATEATSPEAAILVRLARDEMAGRDAADLGNELGFATEELDRILGEMQDAGQVVRAGGRLFARETWDSAEARVLHELEAFHRAEPLRAGDTREGLRSRLSKTMPQEAWRSLLADLERKGRIRLFGERVALEHHRVVLSKADQETADRIEERFRRSGLDPPDPAEVLASEAGPRTARIVDVLIEEERLVRIRDGRLFHRAALEELRAKLRDHARSSRTIDVATFKQLAGVTRKNAIPLLEQLDEERTTRRVGNVREILKPDDS